MEKLRGCVLRGSPSSWFRFDFELQWTGRALTWWSVGGGWGGVDCRQTFSVPTPPSPRHRHGSDSRQREASEPPLCTLGTKPLRACPREGTMGRLPPPEMSRLFHGLQSVQRKGHSEMSCLTGIISCMNQTFCSQCLCLFVDWCETTLPGRMSAVACALRGSGVFGKPGTGFLL